MAGAPTLHSPWRTQQATDNHILAISLVMEYRYSRLVDPETYVTDGLAFDIPLRIHRDPHKEISGALQAQKDWDGQVGPLRGYLGGLGPSYGFISVTIPECRPERLEVMSYANEFAFLYDGMVFRWTLLTNY
jgi:hypothetical protein